MKQNLYDPLVYSVKVGCMKFRLRTGFCRVLQCYQVLSDSSLYDYEKLDLCLFILIRNRAALRFLSQKRRVELYEAVFKNFVDTGAQKTDGPRTFDFEQDAAYIYAGFWQCYGIDLFGKDRELHWWKFVQLFGGLSDDTRIMQIISIRARPIPMPTKYNAEERRNLARLKALYRIKYTQEEQEEQYAKGLRSMVLMLEGLAK